MIRKYYSNKELDGFDDLVNAVSGPFGDDRMLDWLVEHEDEVQCAAVVSNAICYSVSKHTMRAISRLTFSSPPKGLKQMEAQFQRLVEVCRCIFYELSQLHKDAIDGFRLEYTVSALHLQGAVNYMRRKDLGSLQGFAKLLNVHLCMTVIPVNEYLTHLNTVLHNFTRFEDTRSKEVCLLIRICHN